jgi:hypothetical protein
LQGIVTARHSARPDQHKTRVDGNQD